MNNNLTKVVAEQNYFNTYQTLKEMNIYNVIDKVHMPGFQFDINQGTRSTFKADAHTFSGLVESILHRFDFESGAPKKVYINCIPRSNGELVITLTGINCSIERMHDFGQDPDFFKVLSEHQAMIEVSDMVRAACLVGTVFIRLKNAAA